MQVWPAGIARIRTDTWICCDPWDLDPQVLDLQVFFGRWPVTACTSPALVVCPNRNKYVSIQRNAAKVKSSERLLPKPVVIKVKIDGHPAWALIDSGLLGDFISSTLVDQLKLKRNILDKAIGLQLAVQGSRSKTNTEVSAQLEYQNIKGQRQFDMINLNDYDLILGTLWMYQHQVCIGLNC